MNHDMPHWDPRARKRVFEAFYALAAEQIMDRTFERTDFLGPHCPVVDVLELFLRLDHVWILAEEGVRRIVSSILLRRDILRALTPTQTSYSRFSKMRFRSLAHGSADCICCFTEDRVLHPVAPDTSCREVLHTMEAKGVLFIPVVDGGELVGEIAPLHVLNAIHELYLEVAGNR